MVGGDQRFSGSPFCPAAGRKSLNVNSFAPCVPAVTASTSLRAASCCQYWGAATQNSSSPTIIATQGQGLGCLSHCIERPPGDCWCPRPFARLYSVIGGLRLWQTGLATLDALTRSRTSDC